MSEVHYGATEDDSSFIISLVLAAVETSLNVFLMMSVGVMLAWIGLLKKEYLGGISQIWLKMVLPVFLFNKFASFNKETIFSSLSAIVFALAMILMQCIVGFGLFTNWGALFRKILGKSKKDVEGGAERIIPKFIPRNIFTLIVSFQSAIVLPYPYVVSFTESKTIFSNPDRETLGMTFLSIYAFPVLLVYFSFGVWWGRREGKRKAAYDKKYGRFKEKPEENVIALPRWKKFLLLGWSIVTYFPNSVYGMIFGMVFVIFHPLKDAVFTDPAPVVAVIKKVVGSWASAMPPLAYLIIGGNVGFLLSKKKPKATIKNPVSKKKKKKKKLEEEEEIEESTEMDDDDDDELLKTSDDSLDNDSLEEGGEEVSDAPEEEEEVVQKKSGGGGSWNPLNLIFRYNTPYHLIAGVAGKMVVIPILTFAIIVLIGKFAPDLLMSDPAMRPIFYTVLMIEACVPCMLASIVIANAAGAGVDEVSEVVLWQYLVSPILTVIYGIIFIYTFCSMEPDGCMM